jgi:hypothetical protein
MRSLVLAILIAGCGYAADGAIDWFVDGEADHGTVYVCRSGAMCVGGTEEWCWDGDKAELEALLGAECDRITVFERAYPAIVGCAYGCPLEGRGCNAHCGCFCPPN